MILRVSCFALISFLGIILLISLYAKAGEDDVYFFEDPNGLVETEIALVGEDALILRVVFGQNCSRFSIDMDSPLFKRPTSGISIGEYQNGSAYDMSIDIDPNAVLGTYEIQILFNYTTINGTEVSKSYTKTISYIEAFVILNVNIPSGHQRYFSITVETSINLSDLNIKLDSDGDIELDTYEFYLMNPDPGVYSFGANLSQSNRTDTQQLGFHVIGTYGHHKAEFINNNIPVSILWDDDDEEYGILLNLMVALLVIAVLIVVVNLAIYYYRKRANSR